MIKKLLNLENLTKKETYELFTKFSEYSIEKQSAILALFHAKKETTDEILGAIQYFKQNSTKIMHNYKIVDIAGTGGDGINTFNISTAASIIVASCGINVAKHGGRSATSEAGSYDVMQSLGIQTPKTAEEILNNLQKINYVYLFAPLFNKSLKEHGKLRRKLGFPSFFNILAPLLNPMQPKRCVIGVYRKDLMEKIAQILKIQGVKHALIVHSNDGLDEISISNNTNIIEIKNTIIKKYNLNPEDFSIPKAKLSDIKGGNAVENAQIIYDLLSGKINGPKLDIVLINCAAVLYVAGKSKNIKDGILIAKNAVKQGYAIMLLNKIKGSI